MTIFRKNPLRFASYTSEEVTSIKLALLFLICIIGLIVLISLIFGAVYKIFMA